MPSMTEVLAQQILAEINPSLRPDGGSVELVSSDGGNVVVNYNKGSNPDCEGCVMSVEDFQAYVEDLMQQRIPGFSSVKVLDSSNAAA